MLSFFRKYQKIVFGFVTVMLVVSIAFFGTYSAMSDREMKEKDFILGKSIDGSKMSHLDIEYLVRMISTDCLDSDALFKNMTPNYFNDGVIRKDFLESGFASVLVERYFDDLKKDLEERHARQKKFKMYSHPEAPFISAENVYSQFMPSLIKNIEAIKKDSFVVTKESFPRLTEIYIEQSHFPSHLLRRFLGYQEKQVKFVRQDPNLYQGDLSLFHFHTVEDWFGKTFVHLVAQVIHNGAICAKEKGYKVSLEEVRQDLFKTGLEVLKAQKKEGDVSTQELMGAFKQQLNFLRLNEKNALNAWKKVLLFRKLMEDLPQKALVDRLSYDQFHEYASQGVEVEVYKLPKHLRFTDLKTLFKFQLYLESVSDDKDMVKRLLPSGAVKSLEAIRKLAPALLEKTYEIEVAKVSKRDLTGTISLKDTWDWEIKPEHWNVLKAKFPELATQKLETADAKLDYLDHLEEAKRYQIDEFVREKMIESSKQLASELLSQKSLDKMNLKVSIGSSKEPLDGIHDVTAFLELLDKAPLKNQQEIPEEALSASLETYSQDDEHFYRIYVLSRSSGAELLTFEEANQKGLLDEMLDEKLKKHHIAARDNKSAAFLKEDGTFKDFTLVREEIGKYVYSDLLKEIEKTALEPLKKYPPSMQGTPSNFYTTYRFYGLLKKTKEQIEKGIAINADEKTFLEKQLMVSQEKDTVKRSKMPAWADEDLFSLSEGSFSEIKGEKESMGFCKILGNHLVDETTLRQHLSEGQKLMTEEAKLHMMTELMDRLVAKETIHLDKLNSDDEDF